MPLRLFLVLIPVIWCMIRLCGGQRSREFVDLALKKLVKCTHVRALNYSNKFQPLHFAPNLECEIRTSTLNTCSSALQLLTKIDFVAPLNHCLLV